MDPQLPFQPCREEWRALDKKRLSIRLSTVDWIITLLTVILYIAWFAIYYAYVYAYVLAAHVRWPFLSFG